MLTERLNRRHKAGLFLTVVATAACLLAGAAWKESVGVALLGLALTWLIGALTPIHLWWITTCAGLLLATGSVAYQYYDETGTYRGWRSRYDLLPDSSKYLAHDPKTGQKEYWDEIQQQWLRLDQGSGYIESWESPRREQPVPANIAIIPGTMTRRQFAAWLKEWEPGYAPYPDDELVQKVLDRRPELKADIVSGEVVAQGDSKKWVLLAHPASFRAALHEQRTLTSIGMAAFLGGLVRIWLVRRRTIKWHKTATA